MKWVIDAACMWFLQTGLFCLSSFMVDRRCPSTAPKITSNRWNYREHLFFTVKITNSQKRKQLVGLGSGLCACAHQLWPGAVSSLWLLVDHKGQKDQFLEQEIYWLWAKQVSKGIHLWSREMQWQIHQMTAAEWNLPVRVATGRAATAHRNAGGTVTQG